MHCAHLRVNGEKMSKSAGNFFTLRDLLEKGYTGREIRYVLINAHYRTGLNFAFDALDDARKSLSRIDACVERLAQAAKTSSPGDSTPRLPREAFAAPLAKFAEAVNDDLNIPKAFASLFELVRTCNGMDVDAEAANEAIGVFRRMDEVLGVVFFGNEKKEVEIPAEVQSLLDARAEARKAKNWAESDRLRDAIAALGWAVKDSKDAQNVSKLAGRP
jgi:cysteinyl-tRNA synthetase